jgi:hypothetical protein
LGLISCQTAGYVLKEGKRQKQQLIIGIINFPPVTQLANGHKFQDQTYIKKQAQEYLLQPIQTMCSQRELFNCSLHVPVIFPLVCNSESQVLLTE